MKTVASRSILCSLLACPALVATLTPAARDLEATAPATLSAITMPDLATAQETTTVLANALVAAVVSISDATPPNSTATEIDAGSAAISALVPECQQTYRLLDASGAPLGETSQARGRFEIDGLEQLIGGAPVVQQTIGTQLRTLIPLTNDMHANCATCHTNYAALPANTVVGAASLAISL